MLLLFIIDSFSERTTEKWHFSLSRFVCYFYSSCKNSWKCSGFSSVSCWNSQLFFFFFCVFLDLHFFISNWWWAESKETSNSQSFGRLFKAFFCLFFFFFPTDTVNFLSLSCDHCCLFLLLWFIISVVPRYLPATPRSERETKAERETKRNKKGNSALVVCVVVFFSPTIFEEFKFSIYVNVFLDFFFSRSLSVHTLFRSSLYHSLCLSLSLSDLSELTESEQKKDRTKGTARFRRSREQSEGALQRKIPYHEGKKKKKSKSKQGGERLTGKCGPIALKPFVNFR